MLVVSEEDVLQMSPFEGRRTQLSNARSARGIENPGGVLQQTASDTKQCLSDVGIVATTTNQQLTISVVQSGHPVLLFPNFHRPFIVDTVVQAPSTTSH